MAANEIREQAKAKFAEANDYAASKGIKDANDVLSGDVAQGDWDTFNGILQDALALDEQYAKASEVEGSVHRLSDRMDYYSRAVTGKGVGFYPIHEDRPKTLGQQFVEDEGYQALVTSGALNSPNTRFESPRVTAKAASDLIHSNNEGPADALVRPEYRQDILPMPERPLVVRDLFASGTIGSDTLIYAQQSARDSGAAEVGQAADVSTNTLAGGLKPQSSVAWEEKTATVKNLATWMAVTRQTLQDAGVVRSLIDQQGRLMLGRRVDDQLIGGGGSGPDIEGLGEVTGAQTLDLTGADNLDGIRTSIRMVRTGASRMAADSIVIHPNDSEEFDLLKDNNNLYRGGNPIGNFDFGQSIWRLRRVESEAVTEGTAWVGAFRTGATVLQRTPMTVYTTDSHSDFFVRNLVVVLFEERLAFPVWWPSAFVEVTLGSWGDGSGS